MRRVFRMAPHDVMTSARARDETVVPTRVFSPPANAIEKERGGGRGVDPPYLVVNSKYAGSYS